MKTLFSRYLRVKNVLRIRCLRKSRTFKIYGTTTFLVVSA